MWIYIIVYIYIYIIVYVYIYIYIPPPTEFHAVPGPCPPSDSNFTSAFARRAKRSHIRPFSAVAALALWPQMICFGNMIWVCCIYGYIYIWILIHGIPSRKMWDVVLFWKIHGIYTRTNGFCKKKLGKTVGNLRTYRNFRVSNGEQMLLNNNWELRPTRNFRDVWRFHQHWLIHIHPSSTIVYSVAEKTLVSHVMNVYMCNVY